MSMRLKQILLMRLAEKPQDNGNLDLSDLGKIRLRNLYDKDYAH